MRKVLNLFEKDLKLSFSQSGEDLLISFLFDYLQLKSPTYLDIGAHHPSWLSNTYLFYKKGSSGICIEPDPFLFSKFKSKRKRDICLNIGISAGTEDMADFYVMTSRSLNTFSKAEAVRCQESKNYGDQKIEEVIRVPLLSINEIMEKYSALNVNLISIDVEGLDFEIVKNFDFSRYQPEVFCIETLRYDENAKLQKNQELIQFMKDMNYYVYGDTYINTIFINRDVKHLLKISD